MEFNISIGSVGKAEQTAKKEHCASVFASGALEVFSTPFMIAVMEEASTYAIPLPKGYTTVGTKVDIEHLAATPIGMKVTAIATITQVDRKRIVLKVEAYDETGEIGRGTHERFIVESEKFTQRAYAKLNK